MERGAASWRHASQAAAWRLGIPPAGDKPVPETGERFGNGCVSAVLPPDPVPPDPGWTFSGCSRRATGDQAKSREGRRVTGNGAACSRRPGSPAFARGSRRRRLSPRVPPAWTSGRKTAAAGVSPSAPIETTRPGVRTDARHPSVHPREHKRQGRPTGRTGRRKSLGWAKRQSRLPTLDCKRFMTRLVIRARQRWRMPCGLSHLATRRPPLLTAARRRRAPP